MAEVKQRRKIVDRKALMAAIEVLVNDKPKTEWRKELLALIKDAFQKGYKEVEHRHMVDGIKGPEAANANSYLADQLIRIIHDYTVTYEYPLANPTKSECLTLVATGGYGREELAPYSDIDLLFLIAKKGTPWTENVSEYILYFLWDLGWKVGHAIRTPEECVRYGKEDITIRTSLLEGRYLWGDDKLFRASSRMFWAKVIKGTGRAFVEAKLDERDKRHKRMGDTRYVVEPNLKDGKGGLRDLQTLWWIAKYLYNVREPRDLISKGFLTEKEFRAFRKAESFLWTVRCTLHYLADRAEERLTFDWQRQLSEQLQYKDRAGATGVERFMRHYFLTAKEVGDLTRIFCSVLESNEVKKPLLERFKRSKRIKNFKVDGERLTFFNEKTLLKDPVDILRIFHVSDSEGLDIHPDALRLIQSHLTKINGGFRRDAEANKLFLEIVSSKHNAEITLRRMNEAGVLGAFIPDFGRVVAQMQYDMYHHYTVDEHTIRAIGLLAAIEAGHLDAEHPLSSVIIHKVVSRTVLYIAVFLHDIAKGRDGPHSELGAKVAEELCPRLGLSPAETETVAWLVKNHLLMSHVAFKRDLMDPKTIRDFVEQVKSPERLRLLLTLTVVDIRAVGPNVWNGWKGQLLRDLYQSAEEEMVSGHAGVARAGRVSEKKEALANALNSSWSQTQIKQHLKRFDDAYWIAEDLETLVLNAELMQSVTHGGKGIGYKLVSDDFKDRTQASVYTPDVRGLFARVAGAMGVAGANVVGAKIHTSLDGWAIDNFTLQGSAGKAYENREQRSKLEALLQDSMKGSVKLKDRLGNRRVLGQSSGSFEVETMVVVDNSASNRSTVIEINALNRAGLLYDVAYAIYRLKLSIFSAHVDTYGERAVDVFYVRDMNGEKVESKTRLKTIETKLAEAAKGTTT